MNNVTPRPRRGAFTGVAGSDGGVFVLSGVLSGPLPGLFEPPGALGFLLLGLTVAVVEPVLEFAVFSFGREVRNAPRTSSSCRLAETPTPKALRQTNPKIMTLI